MDRPKDSDHGSELPKRRRNTERPKADREHPHEPRVFGEAGEPHLRERDKDPAEVHREYLERHLGGGAPATPEAYARAMEQWRRLPGAVRVSPTDLSGEQAAPEPPDDTQDEEHKS